MRALLNAECPGCPIRLEKTPMEIDVLLQIRIAPDQISTYAIDEVTDFTIRQCR